MPLTQARLAEIATTLSRRPGHTEIQALLNELCVQGLSVPQTDARFEVPVPEVRGRIDALFGETVFEIKRDLRRETADAEEQLTRYLGARAARGERRVLGITTDGHEFRAYELSHGRLTRLHTFEQKPKGDPRALLRWLDTAVAVQPDRPPDAEVIRAEFGRDGIVYGRAMAGLREAWRAARTNPEAALKRQLWTRHLGWVYGRLEAPDELFLQHTYLTLIAKTMAVRVLTDQTVAVTAILEGEPFSRVGLEGAVEVDFFTWVTLTAEGRALADRVSRQVARFDFQRLEVDVLKTLYESLIDPEQRHYLGEYYTPDWLAAWMVEEAIPEPLAARVLDPACGSGTFLFHAVRRHLKAAEAAGHDLDSALAACTERVVGLDVHPVAVLFARVTYLLAIGPERLRRRRERLSLPVYLGDALQWNVRPLLGEQEVTIDVPDEPTRPLRFPAAVAGDPHRLEDILILIDQGCRQDVRPAVFEAWLDRFPDLPGPDRRILVETYGRLAGLHRSGRDHVWKYLIRNLIRPLWLSMCEDPTTVIVGNPPWLVYRSMSDGMKERFRDECRRRGLWSAGRSATHVDLAAYFVARSLECYGREGGRVAVILPNAVLTRLQFAGFRRGRFGEEGGTRRPALRVDAIWSFDSDVRPLFPVPCMVLFGAVAREPTPWPATMQAFHGRLPGRNVHAAQARLLLTRETRPRPTPVAEGRVSVYGAIAKQGAMFNPRRLTVVEIRPSGRFGHNAGRPPVIGRIGTQDKWRNVPSPEGSIEQENLRPTLLGESIGPFRVTGPVTGIVPVDQAGNLINGESARVIGKFGLADWLDKAEQLWRLHGKDSRPLVTQMDHMGKLSRQIGHCRHKIAYTASGTRIAATIIGADQLVDHGLYWVPLGSQDEFLYITAILNSGVICERVSPMQSRGAGGARHFDLYPFHLPIPRFDPGDPRHARLVALAEACEGVAAAVPIDRLTPKAARKALWAALDATPHLAAIDAIVTDLLDA